MSTKTIPVGTDVYEKLANRKRPGESFTKVIDRLPENTTTATCADAVREAAEIWGTSTGPPAEAAKMEKIILDNRRLGRFSPRCIGIVAHDETRIIGRMPIRPLHSTA